MSERALVIGGGGFIGLHVVDALLAAGWDVASTRRKSTPTLLLRRRPIELVHASLDDGASLEQAMAGRDVVMICAGHYPRYSTDRAASVARGVSEMNNALAAALSAGVRRVVYTSSVAVLAHAEHGMADERYVRATGDDCRSVYAAVKREMEGAVLRWRGCGLDVVSIVTGGCLGPWDLRVGTTGVLLGLLNETLPFWTDGWINLVDVHDVARAHVIAIDAPRSHYCVAGHNLRMRAVVDMVAARYGVARPLEVSAERARELADRAEREAEPKRARVAMPRELVDLLAHGQPVVSVLASSELGIDWTPFEETLDRTYAWLTRHHYVREQKKQQENTRHAH